jgi:ribosomal protein L18E
MASSLASKLGSLNKGTTTGKKKPTHPRIPASDQLVQLVDAFVSAKARADAAVGDLEMAKAQLRNLATEPFFSINRDKAEPDSTVIAEGSVVNKGKVDETINTAAVTFKNDYRSATDRDALVALIGEKVTDENFHEKIIVRIDSDKISTELVEIKRKGKTVKITKRELLVERLVELANELGVTDAMDAAVKMVPNADFHTKRHSILDVNTNVELQDLCGCTVQVR